MNAIQVTRFGNVANVVQIAALPELPMPVADEIKIKVTACTVNQSDLAFIKGFYGASPGFPVVAGCEGVGEVMAVGEDVKNYAIGERVIFFNLLGAWSECVLLPERAVAKVAGHIDTHTAVQLMINPFTAMAMIKEARLPQGAFVLITAANSCIARLLILFAVSVGLKPIAIVSNKDHIAEMERLGAISCIVEQTENIYQRVNDITGYKGVAALFDSVAGKLSSEAISCIGSGGTAFLYGSMSNERIPLSAHLLITKNITVRSFQFHKWMEQMIDHKAGWYRSFKEEVRAFINQHDIRLPVAASYHYTDIQSALKHLTQRGRNGKIIITF